MAAELNGVTMLLWLSSLWEHLTSDDVPSEALMMWPQGLFWVGCFMAAENRAEAVQNVTHVPKCTAGISVFPSCVGDLFRHFKTKIVNWSQYNPIKIMTE